MHLGPAQAAVATAHLIARVVYKVLTLAPHASAGEYQVEYQPLRVAQYEQHYRAQQLKYLHKKAARLGFQLTPIWLFLRTHW
jgi:hypothetical protein